MDIPERPVSPLFSRLVRFLFWTSLALPVFAIVLPNLLRSRMAEGVSLGYLCCSEFQEAQWSYYRRQSDVRDQYYAQSMIELFPDKTVIWQRNEATRLRIMTLLPEAVCRHEYCCKILTRQGDHAPGGALNYVVNGKMTKGFAMIAFPLNYGDTNRCDSFIVSHDGRVYKSDLGMETITIVSKMTEFDPDSRWILAK